MNKLSERAIDKINLFLNDKFYNYISLSRREVRILFHIYQNATSEIFELEEENQQLKSQLEQSKNETKQRNDVIDEVREYCNENIQTCKDEQSNDEWECCIEELAGILTILNKRDGTDE